METILFFDTETTGLPRNWKAPATELYNWPRMVQLAYEHYTTDGKRLNGKDYIIKPDGFTIPLEASKLHGITTEKAIKEGENLIEVLKEFTAVAVNSSFIVAHNMAFDEKVLGAELIRAGMANILDLKKKICTMQESTLLCAIPGNFGNYKWPKLQELYLNLFGENFEDAHNAAADVQATVKCFFELVNNYKAIRL